MQACSFEPSCVPPPITGEPSLSPSKLGSPLEGLLLSTLPNPNLRVLCGFLDIATVFVPHRPIGRSASACSATFSVTAFKQIATTVSSLRILYVQLDPNSNDPDVDNINFSNVLHMQLPNVKHTLHINRVETYLPSSSGFTRLLTIILSRNRLNCQNDGNFHQ